MADERCRVVCGNPDHPPAPPDWDERPVDHWYAQQIIDMLVEDDVVNPECVMPLRIEVFDGETWKAI